MNVSVYNTALLTTGLMLHHRSLELIYLEHLKHYINGPSLIPPALGPGKLLFHYSSSMTLLGTSYKWDHAVSVLGRAYLT